MDNSIAHMNNLAVQFLKAGNYNDALLLFRNALHGLHKLAKHQKEEMGMGILHHCYDNGYDMHDDFNIDYFGYDSDEDLQLEEPGSSTTRIIFTALPSPRRSENVAFTVFSHAAMIVEAGDVVNCEFERRMFCSIIAYNMGLSYHTHRSLQTESNNKKARKLYSSAGRLIFHRYGTPDPTAPMVTKECDSSIHCLEVAILNNMGQILFEDSLDYAGSRSCIQQIRFILKQRRPCVDFDLGTFWLNACVVESHTTAPVA